MERMSGFKLLNFRYHEARRVFFFVDIAWRSSHAREHEPNGLWCVRFMPPPLPRDQWTVDIVIVTTQRPHTSLFHSHPHDRP